MPDGFLTVNVTDSITNAPIQGATVNIYSNPSSNGQSQQNIYTNLKSDISGQITNLNLQAPDISLSQQPSDSQPYSEYTVEVIADGYETVIINGTQIFPTIESRQGVPLSPRSRSKYSYSRQNEIVFDIPATFLILENTQQFL